MRIFHAAAATAVMMLAGVGAAQASLKGAYNVTFTVVGGSQVNYCAELVNTGAQGPYSEAGTAALYAPGRTLVASGTYVVYNHVIAAAVVANGTYLSVSGSFTRTSQFNTAVIEFYGAATILGTATFTATREGQKCH